MPLEISPEMDTGQGKAQPIDVEASRAKRIERVKAKYRDRGGIFKPKENNDLINILLAKDVSGLSPSKRAKRKSSAAASRKSSGRKTLTVPSGADASTHSRGRGDTARVVSVDKEDGGAVNHGKSCIFYVTSIYIWEMIVAPPSSCRTKPQEC